MPKQPQEHVVQRQLSIVTTRKVDAVLIVNTGRRVDEERRWLIN